uniref:Phosphatidylinositol transfer protein 16 n=1 Tax=Glossina morsitans morsitans TaxID=37546 RepID=D3TNE0_GLOMM
MSQQAAKPINVNDLQDLKERMKLIAEADPNQYHNDYSLKRYLRAFKTTDDAFQAILKTNKWRDQYGVSDLANSPELHQYGDKARVLRHRDCAGRPIIYIPAKNHNSNTRDIDEMTKFIVKCLEEGCQKCFEEVTDTLCIVFDLAEFSTSCMDMQLVKNLIWLLSKHYPERLGVCLILNSPGFFSTIWPVIRQLIDDNTAQKVIFIDNETELCKYLIPDVLPTDM